jgi:hypothetical protein
MGTGIGVPAEPQLRKLESVSPSHAGALESCFLQVAFGTDRTFRSRTFLGPKARLGIVCHELLERVLSGRIDAASKVDAQAALEATWNSLIEEQERKCLSSELEKHFGPARGWPGYWMLRARAMAKAFDMLGRGGCARGSRAEYLVEVEYRSYGGRLAGRADVVRMTEYGVTIEDYKTGDIYADDDIDGQSVKPQYRRQLQLYAAMHHDATGQWPVSAALVPLTGDRLYVEVTPAEAEAEAQRLLGLLTQYNQRIAEATRVDHLASPGSETCRHCSYRAFCSAFWLASSPEWNWRRAACLRGPVASADRSASGTCRLQIVAEQGTVSRGIVTVAAMRPLELAQGDEVCLVSVLDDEDGSNRKLRITDYTEVRRIMSTDQDHT